ncbi:uncharacterized protein LOC133806795 [Humulus lupulus]|uniref:uncharacterized protein LOC133806795 n=1 Tax=Humulus lupulus TaxID=3486 RepID=UPI002B414CDB|nr:uncharacterized protein LOC133806795 [Humulus lupulus]
MDARIWWDVVKQTRTLKIMTVANFVQVFSKKYYSVVVLATRVHEFVTLTQDSVSVIEYAPNFDRLARFAFEVVFPTEAMRVQRFIRGLKPLIARDVKMTSTELVSFAEILDKALDAEYMETRIWKDGAARGKAKKSKALQESNKTKAQEGQNSGTDKRSKITTPNGNHKNHNNNHNRGNH